MSDTRRAWTPERVDRLLDLLHEINLGIAELANAERRVGDVLERAIQPDKPTEDKKGTWVWTPDEEGEDGEA